jgi:hypothetical protein
MKTPMAGLLLPLLSACAGPPPESADAHAVIRALLGEFVRESGGHLACLDLHLAEATLGVDQGERPKRDGSFVSGWFGSAPTSTHWSGVSQLTPLDPGEVRALDRAKGDALYGPWQGRLAVAIDPADLPVPLAATAGAGGCHEVTRLHAPAFARDIAFISVDRLCEPWCGSGDIYALRRENGRWRVVAVAPTWMT